MSTFFIINANEWRQQVSVFIYCIRNSLESHTSRCGWNNRFDSKHCATRHEPSIRLLVHKRLLLFSFLTETTNFTEEPVLAYLIRYFIFKFGKNGSKSGHYENMYDVCENRKSRGNNHVEVNIKCPKFNVNLTLSKWQATTPLKYVIFCLILQCSKFLTNFLRLRSHSFHAVWDEIRTGR